MFPRKIFLPCDTVDKKCSEMENIRHSCSDPLDSIADPEPGGKSTVPVSWIHSVPNQKQCLPRAYMCTVLPLFALCTGFLHIFAFFYSCCYHFPGFCYSRGLYFWLIIIKTIKYGRHNCQTSIVDFISVQPSLSSPLLVLLLFFHLLLFLSLFPLF